MVAENRLKREKERVSLSNLKKTKKRKRKLKKKNKRPIYRQTKTAAFHTREIRVFLPDPRRKLETRVDLPLFEWPRGSSPAIRPAYVD